MNFPWQGKQQEYDKTVVFVCSISMAFILLWAQTKRIDKPVTEWYILFLVRKLTNRTEMVYYIGIFAALFISNSV